MLDAGKQGQDDHQHDGEHKWRGRVTEALDQSEPGLRAMPTHPYPAQVAPVVIQYERVNVVNVGADTPTNREAAQIPLYFYFLTSYEVCPIARQRALDRL